MTASKFPLIAKHAEEFAAILTAAKRELAAVRTGRANPQVVESVTVLAYGVRSPLQQLASISVPEPSRLVVEPWDKSILKDVERALTEARLGLTPAVVGSTVRLQVPPLTAETRAELIKTVNAKIEQFKIRLRTLRDRIRDEVLQAEKTKTVTQDDRYATFRELDDLTKEYTAKLKDLADQKAKEIATI